MKEFVEELIKQLEERIEENVGWGDDEFFDGQNSAFEWTISVIKKLEEEYLKSGKCMNDYEHYDNCADYIYSKGYNQGTIDRAEELQKCREYGYNKAIDDLMNALCDHCMQQTNECYKLECPFCTDGCDIINIAEQLKSKTKL